MRGKKNNNPFLFKEFEAFHHLCAHKIGFDGVLLGAWANFHNNTSILDIGTGSGLIALMAAQKNANAFVYGIEIHHESAKQAQHNFNSSKWQNRLSLLEGDFLLMPFKQSFDHIITNPPYFLNGLETPAQHRTKARHTNHFDLAHTFNRVNQLLLPGGKFSMIFSAVHRNEILALLRQHNFYIHRITNVFTSINEFPERVLIESVLKKCETVTNNLFVYRNKAEYSDEYINLTKDFYIHF